MLFRHFRRQWFRAAEPREPVDSFLALPAFGLLERDSGARRHPSWFELFPEKRATGYCEAKGEAPLTWQAAAVSFAKLREPVDYLLALPACGLLERISGA